MSAQVDLIVIGLGYVGLSLAQEAVRSGMKVTGYDESQSVVEGLNAGRSHVDDIRDKDIDEMLAGGFHVTASESGLPKPKTVIICVPSSLVRADDPELAAVRAAAHAAGRLLKQDMLVVLESTVCPGVTEEVIRSILEMQSGLRAGVDFHLAFSPERIDPGNNLYGVRNIPKVVGGYTTSCTAAAVEFYGKLCDQVVCARSAREAEMAKILENVYRYVNIALINELAIFCHELNVDVWEVIKLATTKPFGFEAFFPGPGVGGRCIPIDPKRLFFKAGSGHSLQLLQLAEEINIRMPEYIVDRASELLDRNSKNFNGSQVLLLGVTYKKNSIDRRGTPAEQIAREVLTRGARLAYHDPYVAEWQVSGTPVRRADNLDAELRAADLTILIQAHDAYDPARIARSVQLLFDTRGLIEDDHGEVL